MQTLQVNRLREFKIPQALPEKDKNDNDINSDIEWFQSDFLKHRNNKENEVLIKRDLEQSYLSNFKSDKGKNKNTEIKKKKKNKLKSLTLNEEKHAL